VKPDLDAETYIGLARSLRRAGARGGKPIQRPRRPEWGKARTAAPRLGPLPSPCNLLGHAAVFDRADIAIVVIIGPPHPALIVVKALAVNVG
jgi:hypothetical protein